MDRENLKKYNFNFNKKYGQNFIFDHNLLSAIVRDADVNNKDVLEIGPGAGSLTNELAKVCNKVVAYEIDENLRPILDENLGRYNNVQIIFQDILKVDIAEIEKHFEGKYTIVANLPYYITTPIIFKFLENATRLDKLVIMVQYEVAQRLVAKAGSADYGTISVAIDCIGDACVTRKVSRKMFVPSPNVDSAIVTINFDSSKYDINNIVLLRKLIKSAFGMRRKTLVNNLKKDFGLSGEQIQVLFSECKLNADVRGEALSTEQFVHLSNQLDKIMH